MRTAAKRKLSKDLGIKNYEMNQILRQAETGGLGLAVRPGAQARGGQGLVSRPDAGLASYLFTKLSQIDAQLADVSGPLAARPDVVQQTIYSVRQEIAYLLKEIEASRQK